MRTVDRRFGCQWMLVALLVAAGGAERNFAAASEEAYVTLLYGDEFLLGVRVLGKSIRDTGTTKDTVVLVSDGVSDYGKSLLQADGWIVKPISLLANPNLKRPKRFWGVYTKLKIFGLTTYKKVVYLDADTIVVKSIEDLFKCGEFCANLKHSERLNSGVMVVEPSESVFKDMMAKVDVLPSYTGGDQGFLNSYFADFANARLFEPNLTSEESRGVQKIERLSTLYNADVGLYMLANKWMVDERELRVIHYTLGPLKPWDWWTSWLLKPVDVWQNVRDSLKESLPGTAGGTSYQEQLEVKVLFLIPLCVFFFIFFRSRTQIRDGLHGLRNSVRDYARCFELPLFCSSTTLSSITNSGNLVSNWIHPKIPTNLGAISIFICYVSAAASLTIAFMLIPRQVTPWTGILLMYEWTFLGFIIFFGGYLRLVSHWGRLAGALPSHAETEAYDSGKGHQRQNISEIGIGAWSYGLRMAVLAVVAPSLPCIFGISALFARLGLMVGGGMALSAFMTYASEKMAFRAFTRGLEEHDYRRTRVFSYWI